MKQFSVESSALSENWLINYNKMLITVGKEFITIKLNRETKQF